MMQTHDMTRAEVSDDVKTPLASIGTPTVVSIAVQPGATTAIHCTASSRPSRTLRAVAQWFWRGQDLRTLGQSVLPAWAECAKFRRLARVTAALARQARDPLLPGDASDDVSCELYRQSVYWSLRAIERSTETGSPRSQTGGDAKGSMPAVPNLASLWRHADHDALKVVCGAEAVDWFEQNMIDASFAAFLRTPDTECSRWAANLRQISESLIETNERPQARRRTLLRQRVTRIGCLVAIPLLLWPAAAIRRQWSESDRDLARGKPWRASSVEVKACDSPAQSCNHAPGYFFHTQEEMEPWLEIDLGEPKNISEVRVLNRTDCCRDRAAPLVIEVSTDRTAWKIVGKKKYDFSSWKRKFTTRRARWVRVRATRLTTLHLRQVLVLP